MYTCITNCRNVLGEMTLDEALSGRETINSKLLQVVDDVSDAWGIKVLSVEIKNITPPGDVTESMEKMMKAERDKRALILQSEGERQSAITRAEGLKESAILKAEAEAQANLRRAEALKQSQLLEAEGKAKAIEEIAKAEAMAIKVVNEAILSSGTNETVIALKQVEALVEMAKNPANKLILPNDAINSLGSVSAIAETLKMTKESR